MEEQTKGKYFNVTIELDEGKPVFSPCTGKEATYYELPAQATLGFAPANKNVAEWRPPWTDGKKIIGTVSIQPPITQIDLQGYSMQIESFPPAGAHYIDEVGKVYPDNLGQLVRERIEQGWDITEELRRILFGAE